MTTSQIYNCIKTMHNSKRRLSCWNRFRLWLRPVHICYNFSADGRVVYSWLAYKQLDGANYIVEEGFIKK